MNTSMTIKATAPWLMALYIAVADGEACPASNSGHDPERRRQGYLARGSYVFPPEASLRLTKDMIVFGARETPKWNPMNVCSYHLQEAGATPVQELPRARHGDRRARTGPQIGEIDEAGFAEVVGRISFFVNAGMRFVTELAKMRAFVECGRGHARWLRHADPAKRRFRYGVQVNSLGLTEQQPENNVYRILIEMLSVVLSKKARAPRHAAAGLERGARPAAAVRPTMVATPAGGSWPTKPTCSNPATFSTAARNLQPWSQVEERGLGGNRRHRRDGRRRRSGRDGALKAKLVEIQPRKLEAIERSERIVVGVNAFTNSEPSPSPRRESIHVPSAVAEADQVAALVAWRAERDEARVREALLALSKAAASGGISCPPRSRRRRPGPRRRMGRRAACGIRNVSRADRRLTARPSGGGRPRSASQRS